MNTNPTDRVVDELFDSLRCQDMRRFADQWAADGIMEFPFAPPGYPRLVGRDAVWDYVKDFTDTLRLDTVTERHRHHTSEPNTVIVEFSVEGQAVKTDLPYHQSYISVITLGADGIALYRDYWNSLTLAISMGGIDALMSEFASGHDE